MRNDEWLKNRLDHIWQVHFANVSRVNEVTIEFGRSARTRLGSIKQTRKTSINHQPSIITITGYFKDERVPEFMIYAVIAHELCHYAHGFSSPHPQLLRHPHLGGAVDREMIKRGLGDMLLAQQKWLKTEWKKIIINNFQVKSRKSKVKRKLSIFDVIFR